MKRPTIKDVAASRYADYLEGLLKEFQSETTKVKSYKALKNFVETNSKVLEELSLSADKMSDKEDKLVERTLKFANEILHYNETLDKLYNSIGPILAAENIKEATGQEAALRKFLDEKR
jgi:hypothetical protein